MLTITSEQMMHLRGALNARGYQQLYLLCAPRFQALVDAGRARERFDDWFNARLADCTRWDIRQPANVQSILDYCLVYYPDFPVRPQFSACLQAIEDPGLTEGEKTDRVNHRLLFVR